MYYMDREGHRIKKTTSQDKFLKFVYTHTATRVLMRPLLLPAVSRLGGKLLNTKYPLFLPDYLPEPTGSI